MTEVEAQTIVDQLKAGKRFMTRFQEESWGIRYLGDGRFEYYASRMISVQNEDGTWGPQDETTIETWDETAVIRRFKIYSYNVIATRLR